MKEEVIHSVDIVLNHINVITIHYEKEIPTLQVKVQSIIFPFKTNSKLLT